MIVEYCGHVTHAYAYTYMASCLCTLSASAFIEPSPIRQVDYAWRYKCLPVGPKDFPCVYCVYTGKKDLYDSVTQTTDTHAPMTDLSQSVLGFLHFVVAIRKFNLFPSLLAMVQFLIFLEL